MWSQVGRLAQQESLTILLTTRICGISQAIALVTRRDSTMIAVANFISLPLLFLSTTFLARSQMPHWMRIAARFNPSTGESTRRVPWSCPTPIGARSASI